MPITAMNVANTDREREGRGGRPRHYNLPTAIPAERNDRPMYQRTDFNDLPPDLAVALRQTDFIVRSYLAGLSFLVQNTSRDPSFLGNHLLSYLAQDVLQSTLSVVALAAEGMLNVARRELRFLLEASIKICFVQRASYGSSVDDKLAEFDKVLASQRISIKENLDLDMLPDRLRTAFAEEVGRLYGLSSAYVHLTPAQILASIEAAEAGVSAGKERPADVEALNGIAERVMAASLVLLLHSVPDWVAGDWLVEGDGASIDWHFMGSRFIAGIDNHFDYKHERQATLETIQRERKASIRF